MCVENLWPCGDFSWQQRSASVETNQTQVLNNQQRMAVCSFHFATLATKIFNSVNKSNELCYRVQQPKLKQEKASFILCRIVVNSLLIWFVIRLSYFTSLFDISVLYSRHCRLLCWWKRTKYDENFNIFVRYSFVLMRYRIRPYCK